MRSGFMRGITAGALIGAAAGMFFMPEMDRGTKRKLKKTAKYMRNFAGDAYDEMRTRMR